MPEVTFGSWKHSKSPHLRFSSPHKTYSADELDQVIPLGRAAETAAKSGAWVALMLSYEAAPAFDDALTTHNATVRPLAWAAVFDQPDDEATLNTAAEIRDCFLGKGVGSTNIPVSIRQGWWRIRSLIARGDTYQVNYTFPLVSQLVGDPLAWYHHLCAAQERITVPISILAGTKFYVSRPSCSSSASGDFMTNKADEGNHQSRALVAGRR